MKPPYLTALAIAALLVAPMFPLEVTTVGATGLADAPWPMYRHDAAHTGRSQYELGDNGGAVMWTRDLYELDTPGLDRIRCYSRSPIIGPDGALYFVSNNDGAVVALEPDGGLRWYVATNGSYSAPALSDDGTLYVNCGYELHAINSTGHILWTAPGCEGSSPALGPDGTIYTGHGGSDSLLAYYPNGTLRWEFNSGQFFDANPAIGPDGNVYVHDRDTVYCIDNDGEVLWLVDLDDQLEDDEIVELDGESYILGDVLDDPLAISEDGTVYVLSDLSAFAVADGVVLWECDFPEREGEWWQLAIGSEGTVYATNNDGLYAISPNGNMEWSTDVGGEGGGADALTVTSDDVILVGKGYMVAAFNDDGDIRWRARLDEYIYSDIVVGEDGTLYFFASTWILYALNGEQSGTVWLGILAVVVLGVAVVVVVLKRRRERSTQSET